MRFTEASAFSPLPCIHRTYQNTNLSVAGVKAEKTKTAPKELAHSFLA
jgi:hypothetical protein